MAMAEPFPQSQGDGEYGIVGRGTRRVNFGYDRSAESRLTILAGRRTST